MATPPHRKSWALRGTLAAASLAIGLYASLNSFAQVAVKRDPELAARLAPGDGRILGALAITLAQPGGAPGDATRAAALARRSLTEDPTAVLGAETLGALADNKGDDATARTAFGYADRLSRRGLYTRLWMVENAVQQGDVAAALHQYDITLRVLPNLSEILYPILASAGSDPQIADAFVATLAKRPPWTTSFVEYLASKGPDRRATATLLSRFAGAGVPVSGSASSYAIDALIGERHYPEAWAYYTSVRTGAERTRSRDPQFAAELEAPSRFDWNVVNDGSISGAIQRNVFEFAASAGVGGPMLTQAQWLPPGSYRLLGRAAAVQGDPGALPVWTLSCGNGRELGRTAISSDGPFTATFTVPSDCPFQILTLSAQPSDAIGGTTGQIRSATLSPLR